MKINYLCPIWGNELPFDDFVGRVKQAGFDGIEMSLPIDDDSAKHRMIKSIFDADLFFVGQRSPLILGSTSKSISADYIIWQTVTPC